MSVVKVASEPKTSKGRVSKPGLVFLPFDGGLVERNSYELTDYSHRIVDICTANNSTLILTTHRTRAEISIITNGYPEYFRKGVPFITEYGAELTIPVAMGVKPPMGARRVSSEYVLPLWNSNISLRGIHNVYLHLKRQFAIISLLDVGSETLAQKTGTSLVLTDALKLRSCTLPIILKNHEQDSLQIKQHAERHKLTVVGEGSLQYIMHPSCEKSIAMGVTEIVFAESKQAVHFSVGVGVDATDEKVLEYCDYPIKIDPKGGATEQVFRNLLRFFEQRSKRLKETKD